MSSLQSDSKPSSEYSFPLEDPRIHPVIGNTELYCTASILLVDCSFECAGSENALSDVEKKTDGNVFDLIEDIDI